ncbi:MAG: uracil-DNA glycosylase [Ramlibacter sp.]|uniref:uracil-DNA glycosylase n=1 Tax=Ramlibacter sp. TaxID=1917967 RepID=UPI0026028ACB|nr:uracil-DNA glycosylase [Ramlibacter sp.]MDB5752141.1 uracil-DNA glycosylase [Ramlibacter sp.]MDB5790257.1 uracil-DNA glycosylase [Massilia sp.]
MTHPTVPGTVPEIFLDMLALADPSWRPHLVRALEAVARAEPCYLPALALDDYLPTGGRLFAAFAQPLSRVRYVLVGEGPYPRAESATGVCFMDGAVGELWSEAGLSKPVNRATSLRNFMKMLLVAGGQLQPGATGGAALAPVAAAARENGSIRTLAQLQDNLVAEGFLLLNAALVFRKHVAPKIEALAWMPFLQTVLAVLAEPAVPPTLVLWGKIAEQLARLPETAGFPQAVAEHPYNLSFIGNQGMVELFGPMRLLQAR